MKHVLDVYLGGESDPVAETIPKHYERFFHKRWIFAVLAMLVAVLLVTEAIK